MMGKKGERSVGFDVSDEILKANNEILPVADEMRVEIIKFVNSYLERMGMEVVTDDPELEPVTTAGATSGLEGHVTINFYFKQKKGEEKARKDWC